MAKRQVRQNPWVASRVKELLDTHKLTQQAVSAAAGRIPDREGKTLSSATLSSLLKYNSATDETLHDIAQALTMLGVPEEEARSIITSQAAKVARNVTMKDIAQAQSAL